MSDVNAAIALAVAFFSLLVPACFIPCDSNSDCNRGEACNVGTGKCEIQTDAGNPMAAYTGATPVVTFTMPLDGTVGVPPQSTLSIVFSTPMNALSLTSQTFVVVAPDGGAMEGTRVADPVLPIWTFTPVFSYANQQPTTVTITTGATSLVGTALATPYTFTFVSVTQ